MTSYIILFPFVEPVALRPPHGPARGGSPDLENCIPSGSPPRPGRLGRYPLPLVRPPPPDADQRACRSLPRARDLPISKNRRNSYAKIPVPRPPVSHPWRFRLGPWLVRRLPL